MKLTELEDRLEDLQGNLLINYEMANTIELSLDEGIINEKQILWAMIGLVRNAENAAKEVGNLIDEVINMRKRMECIV